MRTFAFTPNKKEKRSENILVFLAAENGNYSQWSDWSLCSATCGVGSRTRTRSCTNPSPSPYGDDCSHLGNDTQIRRCNLTSCQGGSFCIVLLITNGYQSIVAKHSTSLKLECCFCPRGFLKNIFYKASYQFKS